MSGDASWPCEGNVVQFNFLIWAAVFPSLASVGPMAAGIYWTQAGLYLDNTPTSPVGDLQKRAMILGMITAHIATLFGTVNGNAPSGLVGRISNAAEGSVSVAPEMPGPMSAAWFNQTSFGAAAWQAMAPYRQALYIAAPQIPLAQQSYPAFFGPFGTTGSRGW